MAAEMVVASISASMRTTTQLNRGLKVRHDPAMHYPAVVTALVASVPLLGIIAGVVGALWWRHRAVRRGLHVTALRSIIAVFNGVALGMVAGVTLFLVLAVTLPHPA